MQQDEAGTAPGAEVGGAAVRGSERFEQATLAMALVGVDGTVLSANLALAALLRRDRAELEQAGLTSLAESADAVSALERAVLLAAGGEPVVPLDVELAGVPCRLYWTAVRRDDHRPAYLTLIVVDETERVHAQQELVRATRRWQALLRGAAHITYAADEQGRLTWITASVGSLLGPVDDDLVGSRLVDLVHPDDRASAEQRWCQVASGELHQAEQELRLRRGDGSHVWVRHTVTDLREEPEVRALVGNVVDVTEQRRASALAAHHEQRFRARFEQSTVPQSFVGRDGVLTDVNDAFSALLGRPRKELVGQHVRALNAASDTGAADRVLALVLSGQQPAAAVERLMTGPGGRPVSVLVEVTGLRDADGEPDGAAAFLHDLTGLRDAQARQERQEQFFLAITARAADAALVTDATGRIVHASTSVQHLLGLEPWELLGSLARDLVHPDDLAEVQQAYASAGAGGQSGELAFRVRHADGAWRSAEAHITNLLDTAVGGIVANLRDVTERVEAEQALRASEARYRALADTAQEGIWAASLDGVTLYANQRAADLLGVPLDQVLGRPVVELLDGPTGAQFLARLATRTERGTERYELPFSHPVHGPRTYVIAASPLPRGDGTVEGALAMITDVTDARRAEQELRYAALHDELTGLPNRALLQDRLEHALQRETVGTAALFLDLDQFKLVNDSRGHAAGDQLLVRAADRLRSALRPQDTLARFGGDEFVVVCEDTDQEQARQVADDLMTCLEEPLLVDGDQVHVRASVGVAVTPAASAGDLLRFADTAMYAAKAAGRGRVHVYDRQLSEAVEQRHVLVAELRVALADGGLDMHYQPVLDLGTGRVLGVEALARWSSPVSGPVPPSRFVAAADVSGLSPDLDRWAVRRALTDAARLRSAGRLPQQAYVAVNLSARNLADPSLVDLVVGAAAESGTPPGLVALEITEGAVMGDARGAISTLSTLRGKGFRVLLDDFGTGYSSLAYLRDLPITGLKVDRSFVSDLDTDADALAIVTSIVDLARAVDVGVVAEGVETDRQAGLLRAVGCAAAQGWLWAPALPVHAFEDDDWTGPRQVVPPATRGPAPRQPAPTEQVGAEHGLQRLLELHGAGASLASIAAALNGELFRTPSGSRWHRNTVARAVAAHARPSLIGSR